MTIEITYTQPATDDVDDAFDVALAKLRRAGGVEVGELIGERLSFAGPQFERRDPSQPRLRASSAPTADAESVRRAVEVARVAQHRADAVGVADRCDQIARAAQAISERQVELAALVSMETGKPRHETLAEIQEAVALIATYTAQARETNGFSTPGRAMLPDETSTYLLRPYGVFGIIIPFNFPCALAINMTVAALLLGNAVVAKTPEYAPASAGRILEILAEQLPSGLLNIIHGGAAVGRSLVDAGVDGVAFTGSVEVGRGIARSLQAGAVPRPVIAELGGSNPTIVTESANLDAAAAAIARAAFGLAGQKCTACSRVIVLDSISHDLTALVSRCMSELRVGDPADRDTFMGPLISEQAVELYDEARANAIHDGEVVCGTVPPSLEGHFVEPLLVSKLPVGHQLTRREYFIPMLTMTSVPTVERAIEEANNVEYGLAAGLFASDAGEVDLFLRRIEAGVVYVNHHAGSTTGAWPGAQSMCGWKASGTTGKGGLGPHYIPQFGREQSRTVKLSN